MTVALAQCAVGDEYMPDSGDDVNIGLKNDQIMQRYLVRRIFKESEFVIKEYDGDTVTGFITGLDDRCIQVSTTPRHDLDEPLAVLIFWPIRKISETGRKLDALEHEHRSNIRRWSHALRAQCENFMNGKTQAQRARPTRRLEAVPTAPRPVFSEA